MTGLRVLVLGGGDVGSAVAHRLFGQGMCVLLSERPRSAHARRGMAYTDALFDGTAMLEDIEARLVSDVSGVTDGWQAARYIPIITLPEDMLLRNLRFDALVDATMRRDRTPPDLRCGAEWTVGLGPGYRAGLNCTVAIETQWGPSMGAVLREGATAERRGGPRPLAGVGRERFVSAPVAGIWRTSAVLGCPVRAGEPVGCVLGTAGQFVLRAPIDGRLRGLARDGVEVHAEQRLVEVDPREPPQIFGLGERPLAIARGVVEALRLPDVVPAARDGSA
jgi:xanthine dehydrogenase accessory factor